jgi:hypothetical protein
MKYILYLIIAINSELYEIKKITIMENVSCDTAKEKILQYKKDVDLPFNENIMNDGNGIFYGCICK